MTVKTKISFKEYVKLTINILFEKIIAKLIFIWIFLAFVSSIISYIFHPENTQNLLGNIVLVLFIIFLSIIKYLQLRKIYKTNTNIKEELAYTFSNEKIIIQGKTFKSEIEWKTIYEIRELKNLFLILYDSHSKNMIPKKDFTKDQILELRNIIKSNNVKSKLRND